MNKHLPFDEFVKDKFENFEPEVPQRIWDNIVAEKNKRKPAGFFDSHIIGKALLIAALLISAITFYFALPEVSNSQNEQRNETDIINNSSKHQPKNPNSPSLTQQATTDGEPNASKATSPAIDLTKSENSAGKTNTLILLSDKSGSQILSQSEIPVNRNKSDYDKAGNSPQINNETKVYSTGNLKQNLTNNVIDVVQQSPVFDNTSSQKTVVVNSAKRFSTAIQSYNILMGRKALVSNTISHTPLLKLPDCPTIEKDAAGNKKYIEAYVGPDYAFNNYKAIGDSSSAAYATQRKQAVEFSSAYSAGIRYTRVFDNAMSVRAGVNFSQINEKFKYVNPSDIRFVTVITTRVIVRAPGDTIYVNDTLRYQQSGTRVKTTSNRYRSIDIPLMIGYEVGNGRLHANISAGAIINLYSWYKGDMLDTNYLPVSITTGKGNSNYQYKTNIGVGFISSVSVYYKLNENWHLMLEPYFRYNLSPMSKEKLNVQQRYHTAGIRAGIRFDLGQRNY